MRKRNKLETERLILKPVTEEDADLFLPLLNTPKWLDYVGDRQVHTLQEAKAYIEEKMTPQMKRLGFTNNVVIRKLDGVKMGCCGLFDREGVEGLDIGFAFLPDFENQGYAYESASKLLSIAFSDYGHSKVSAITIKRNLSSRKLLEKLGLTFKKFIRIPDDPEELMLYELEKS